MPSVHIEVDGAQWGFSLVILRPSVHIEVDGAQWGFSLVILRPSVHIEVDGAQRGEAHILVLGAQHREGLIHRAAPCKVVERRRARVGVLLVAPVVRCQRKEATASVHVAPKRRGNEQQLEQLAQLRGLVPRAAALEHLGVDGSEGRECVGGIGESDETARGGRLLEEGRDRVKTSVKTRGNDQKRQSRGNPRHSPARRGSRSRAIRGYRRGNQEAINDTHLLGRGRDSASVRATAASAVAPATIEIATSTIETLVEIANLLRRLGRRGEQLPSRRGELEDVRWQQHVCGQHVR